MLLVNLHPHRLPSGSQGMSEAVDTEIKGFRWRFVEGLVNGNRSLTVGGY